ncbi:MAG: Gfo/Idh/MocA family protein [Gemmataceae bacterium]
MALDMTPEEQAIGEGNFKRVVGQLALDDAAARQKGLSRRDFMKGMLAAGGVALPLSAAAYFGYDSERGFGKPVKAGLIGAGDEGGVLVGEHNPAYLEFVAYSDIRPSNQKRIFQGELHRNPNSPRKGFYHMYGSDAKNKIKQYDDYHQLLDDPDIEAVVIALPLHLHAPVAIEAMQKGKHVLCEKLMAWNIDQCKQMIQAAREHDKVLSIGHQRHYSMLYAHANEVIQAGVLGDVKHIRALWHRNNTPPRGDSWSKAVPEEDRKALESTIQRHGYKSMEELVRWRLYNRTGGGLMAELGSHQLDACSIFLGKVHPLAVSGVGGKFFYKDDREVEDHVFVTFEFPGKNYYVDPSTRKEIKDPNDIVIVTYSSISTNAFEPYGECVMGRDGTMVVETEAKVMLWKERGSKPDDGGRRVDISVTSGGGSSPALDASASTGPAAAQAAVTGGAALGAGPVSKGYREEMEHFAYCIRMWQQGASKEDRPKPHCDGVAAMADAIMALTANQAMRKRERIVFQDAWFDPDAKEVPDADMKPEEITV